MNILSIQSWVAYGHVGNASAMFPLQRLGAEVWAINTVQFSNHTGYGHWTGDVFSGAQVRGANPSAVYCCDPVIGDDRDGVYVRPGIAEMLRDRMLPAADIATPNRFELDMLTGTACHTLDQAKASVAQVASMLHPGGPRCVLLTSLRTEATPDDATDMLVSEAGRFHLLRTPLLKLDVNGAGDAVAALFLFHRLRSGSEVIALEAAGSAIYGVLRLTEAAASSEILTVAAQQEFVAPGTRLLAQPC